jgi:hypothetical protein
MRLHRLFRRRCQSYYPVQGGWSLRCQERAGHDGDHRHGTVITWPQYTPSGGHVHVPGRRR